MSRARARTPSVIVADDHPLFRIALRLGVREVAPAASVVEVDSFDSLKQAVAQHPDTDLVLLDLLMPGVDGLSALLFLREHAPALRVAIVSTLGQGSWARAVQGLGAVAFVHKSVAPERLIAILRALLEGQSWWPEEAAAPAVGDGASGKGANGNGLDALSRQELRVLLHLKEGRVNKQIARDLGITESTVKVHLSSIMRKLGVHNRAQAAVYVQRLLADGT